MHIEGEQSHGVVLHFFTYGRDRAGNALCPGLAESANLMEGYFAIRSSGVGTSEHMLTVALGSEAGC